MKDKFNRKIEYARISVTQKCNLSCVYCRPHDKQESSVSAQTPGGLACSELCSYELKPEEFEAVVRVMVGLGITKIRLTGGEPLVRSDICEIVKRIASIPGLSDLSMTTNGIYLYKYAKRLKEYGLNRINISIDSLKDNKFSEITGGGSLRNVLEGIEKAAELGFNPIKINTVLIKGVNDDEIDSFFALAKDKSLEVRFIELMPVGRFGELNTNKIVYNSDIISAHPELIPCENVYTNHPASYYTIDGYKGKIGFISPMSHKFCGSCNRIRLTSDGKIKPCLGDNGEVNIIDAIRTDREKLAQVVEEAVYMKPEGHSFHKKYSSLRNMNMIGG